MSFSMAEIPPLRFMYVNLDDFRLHICNACSTCCVSDK